MWAFTPPKFFLHQYKKKFTTPFNNLHRPEKVYNILDFTECRLFHVCSSTTTTTATTLLYYTTTTTTTTTTRRIQRVIAKVTRSQQTHNNLFFSPFTGDCYCYNCYYYFLYWYFLSVCPSVRPKKLKFKILSFGPWYRPGVFARTLVWWWGRRWGGGERGQRPQGWQRGDRGGRQGRGGGQLSNYQVSYHFGITSSSRVEWWW